MPSSKKKILHLITSLGGGGTENFLYQIASHAPSNVLTTVASIRKGGVIADRLKRSGVEVRNAPTPWHVARLIDEIKPDILHTCLFWGNQFGRFVGHMKHVPRLISSQRAIQTWEKPWHSILDRWTLPWCDGIIVNSMAAEVLIQKRTRGNSHIPEIVRIPNGLDFSRFVSTRREDIRRQYNLPAGTIVGGTMGRLHYEKGSEKTPALAKNLLATNPHLVLLVAGVGPLEKQLKDQTREWGDRIRFVGWQEDAVSFLSALDFFWLLSREESFPQALLEASGMGLPWAAPDVGDVAELKNSGAAGILYPVGNLDAASRSCQEIINRLPEWSSNAAKSRATLENRYSLERMIGAFYAFLSRTT